jgi:hypothetical protein
MALFRLVPGDFRWVSKEILYDRALRRTAKAGLRLRLSPLFSPCYATEQGDPLPVLSLDRCVSNFSQETEIQHFHASIPVAARPPFPLLAGHNRENSGFGETASDARRQTDRQDFLSRIPLVDQRLVG